MKKVIGMLCLIMSAIGIYAYVRNPSPNSIAAISLLLLSALLLLRSKKKKTAPIKELAKQKITGNNAGAVRMNAISCTDSKMTSSHNYTKSNNCNGCAKQNTCEYGYETYDFFDHHRLALWEKFVYLNPDDFFTYSDAIGEYINRLSRKKKLDHSDVSWLTEYLEYEECKVKKLENGEKCAKAYLRHDNYRNVVHNIELALERANSYSPFNAPNIEIANKKFESNQVKQNENDTKPTPCYNEKDLKLNFLQQHGKDIKLLERTFEDSYRTAYDIRDLDEKIEKYELALEQFGIAKEFCYTKGYGGEIYFQDTWEHIQNSRGDCYSYCDMIMDNIISQKRKRGYLIPAILDIVSQNDGILQKNIYSLIDSPRESIWAVINELASQGKISKIKKGNSFELYIN